MNNINDKDRASEENNTSEVAAAEMNRAVPLCDRSNRWLIIVLIIILIITTLQMSELLKILDALRKMNGNL
ncbi:MAG: hypothetical protein WC788_03055 [Candidatus Paceibacterota bacterium]|jgi:hypothetical protein